VVPVLLTIVVGYFVREDTQAFPTVAHKLSFRGIPCVHPAERYVSQCFCDWSWAWVIKLGVGSF